MRERELMDAPFQRRLCACGRFALYSCLVTMAALAQQTPDWYNKVQFFAGFEVGYYVNGGALNGPQYANAAPFTGVAWGYEPPEPTQELLQAREISAWHASGRLYRPGTWLDSPQQVRLGTDPFPNASAALCTNVSGGPLGTNGLFTNSFREYSISNATYQQYLMAELKQAIDDGADGFQFDAVGYLPGTVLQSSDAAGCFDSASMAAFRDYLTGKYSASDLSTLFQITDPSTFDYGKWIAQQGTQKTWNQQPLSGLAREFFLFQMIAERTFVQQAATFAHQYAQSTYGRTVTVSGNTALQRYGEAYYGGPDYFVNETHFFSPGSPSPLPTADIRAYRGATGTPVVAELERVVDLTPEQNFPANLLRLAIADVYSAGGIASIGHGSVAPAAPPPQPLEPLGVAPGATGPPPAITSGVLQRYAQFVVGHPALFENLQSAAQVALLNSTASRNGWLYPVAAVPGQPPPSSYVYGDGHYYGAAQLLIDSNIPYDSILAPDSNVSAMPSVTLAQLQKYRAVLLPDAYALDDGQANTILAYVQGGGMVIAIDPAGINDLTGQIASRPELLQLQSAEGATPYGGGVFVHTAHGIDLSYFLAEQNHDNATKASLLQTFQALISPYLTPPVVTGPVSTVFRTGGATASLWRGAAGNLVMDLVNYDYDITSDTIASKDNVAVTVAVGSQPVDEVILWSPDATGPQALPFSQSSGTITLTVPHLDVWAVLSVQQNAAAPVIQSTSPAQNVGATGGSTLNFIATAQDPDSNPIAYSWTVNGQAIPNSFGPQLSWQAPQTAAGGTYIIVVTVTDGSRITQNSWTVTVAAFHSPRVLFDEAHGEMFTLDPAQATDPSRLLTNLANAMQTAFYNVTPFKTGPLSSASLANTDVLILPAPLALFTSDEMQAIWTFVKNGGGLIFLAQNGIDQTWNNPLLAPFGLQVDGRLIQWQDPGIYPYGAPQVDVTTWASHPALANLTQFQDLPVPDFITFYGASFFVTAPAVALGSTSASAWRGIGNNGNIVASPGSGLGPFVVVAASQLGNGRVFAIASGGSLGNTQNSDTFTQDNRAIFLSGLSWVASGPVAAVAPGPVPSFVGAVNGASFTSSISPGSWVSIVGKNLANTGPAGQSWSASDFHGNQLPLQLAGASVLINGRSAAISFASPAQLNVQAPDDTASAPVPVEIFTPGGILHGSAALAPLAPAIFQVAGKGITYAAAVALDGTLIAHPGDFAGARPAQPGETVEVFGTGFGASNPAQAAGQLVQTAPLTNTVTATLCRVPAAVSWAGLVAPGLDQINLTIPSTGVTGDCSIQFSGAGNQTQAGVSIPVQ
jgi:uncharacterized protein (TIGR03437 family)